MKQPYRGIGKFDPERHFVEWRSRAFVNDTLPMDFIGRVNSVVDVHACNSVEHASSVAELDQLYSLPDPRPIRTSELRDTIAQWKQVLANTKYFHGIK